jgi:hypothetical protein
MSSFKRLPSSEKADPLDDVLLAPSDVVIPSDAFLNTLLRNIATFCAHKDQVVCVLPHTPMCSASTNNAGISTFHLTDFRHVQS